MTEKEKMLAGEPYRAADPQLVAERRRCRTLLHRLHEADDEATRAAALEALLGHAGEGAEIVPPFACDYGYNIRLGKNAWLGGGAIVLPGRRVGANSVVGAGSVVTRDVPPNTVVAGNPARVINRL